MTQEALKLALEALENISSFQNHTSGDSSDADKAITALEEALAQPKQDSTYTYASSLATAIWQKHYMKESPKWKPLDTTEGVLTQIDNMTCGLIKEKPAQPEQEPVMWSDYESNGIHHKPVAQTQEPFCLHWEDRWGCNHYADPKEPHPVNAKPLYTAPPQRTWVGLTDEQRSQLVTLHHGWNEYGQAIEASLKQQNGYAEEKNT